MLKQIEGSHAMAEAIALCRPEVICAYPISRRPTSSRR
jgi:pyruvate ferredoxin oxidoreductase alpha subunit